MEPEVRDEKSIKRYLLGELAGDEQTRLEERLMTDQRLFDSLLEAENELTDDYARGLLHGAERERFENHFLVAPERREKLGFALAFRRYVAEAAMESAVDDRRKPSWLSSLLAFFRAPSPALAWSLAAATLLLAIGSAWLLIETARLRNQLPQAQNPALEQQLAEQRARNRELAEQLASEQSRRAQLERDLAQSKQPPPGKPATPTGIFSLALLPGLARDPNQGSRIELPPDAAQLRLRLELEAGDYPSYRAELLTDEGRTIRTFDRLKARRGKDGNAVIVSLPARPLSGGDYRVALSGATAGANYERIGTYFFTVVRK